MIKNDKSFCEQDVLNTVNKIIKKVKLENYSKEGKIVLLGGQPGAGKTKMKNLINTNKEYVFVSADDYRQYHPLYEELNKKYGKDDSLHTHKFVGEITQKLMNNLMSEKYNLIVEGTLRTYELPLKDAKKFKQNGYSEVNLAVIVVKPEKSYLGILSRYEQMIENGLMPRMVGKYYHDLVAKHICENLSKLYEEKAFNNIQLYDRENNLLYDMKKTPEKNPTDILEHEFNKKWTKEECEKYKKEWNTLFEKMENRKANPKEIEDIKKEYENIIKNIVVEKKGWQQKLENDKDKGMGIAD